MSKFPKISQVLTDGSFGKFNFNYAIIKNGRIQAVNRHSGVYLNALDYMSPEQLEHCEGFAFDAELVKKMEEADDIEFRPDSLNLKYGVAGSHDGMTTIPYKYSGKIKNDGEIDAYCEMFDDYCDPTGKFFEGLETILKNIVTPDGKIDVTKWSNRETYFKSLKFSYTCLEKIIVPLRDKMDDEGHIDIHFYHSTTKDKVETPTQPLVLSTNKTLKPESNIVFMMPSLNKK